MSQIKSKFFSLRNLFIQDAGNNFQVLLLAFLIRFMFWYYIIKQNEKIINITALKLYIFIK